MLGEHLCFWWYIHDYMTDKESAASKLESNDSYSTLRAWSLYFLMGETQTFRRQELCVRYRFTDLAPDERAIPWNTTYVSLNIAGATLLRWCICDDQMQPKWTIGFWKLGKVRLFQY